MKNEQLIILFFILVLVFGGTFFIFHNSLFSATDSRIDVTVKIAVCGNNIKENGEQCDGADLGGASCATQGYRGGSLSCNPSCTFNTSACVAAPPGGGGGERDVPPFSPPLTGVTLSGKAYPKRTVTILKDAQVAATTIADANANFQVSITGISVGNYIFSVYSEDHRGNRSSLSTFPVSVTSGVIVNIGGIFIAPTIDTDKSVVKHGDNIAIFGKVAPTSEVTIGISSEDKIFIKTMAGTDGIYLLNFDTSVIEIGQHYARSSTRLAGSVSAFSRAIDFKVGTRNVTRDGQISLKGDLNADNKVSLVDFSIAAYWYKRPISAEFAIKEKEMLNGDGKVDLVDFSIMAYYWTG